MNPLLYEILSGGNAPWVWEPVVPLNTEPSGNRGGAIFAKDGTKFLLAGGRTQASVDLADYWTFDTTTSLWTQVVGAGLTRLAVPIGFASGGNLYHAAGNGKFFGTPGQAGKIVVATGVQANQADAGTASIFTGSFGRNGATVYNNGWLLDTYRPAFATQSAVQTAGANTRAQLTTSASVTRMIQSSIGYHPATNTLYQFAPVIATPGVDSWTLGVNDIAKYDLTAATGWTIETGVVNAVGAENLGRCLNATHQLVWWPAESVFILFVGQLGNLRRIISFDPVTKIMSELVYGSQPGAYVLGPLDSGSTMRGDVGTVVVDGDGIYFVNCASLAANTAASIWKFRRGT